MQEATFAERYCQARALSQTDYARSVFRQALYLHARPITWLVKMLRPKFFDPDFKIIEDMRWARHSLDLEEIMLQHEWSGENKSKLRRVFRVRMSTTRLRGIFEQVMSLPAPEVPEAEAVAEAPAPASEILDENLRDLQDKAVAPASVIPEPRPKVKAEVNGSDSMAEALGSVAGTVSAEVEIFSKFAALLPGLAYQCRFSFAEGIKVDYVGVTARDMLGHEAHEFRNRPDLFFELVHPDDRLRFMTMCYQSMRQPGPCEAEYRVILPDGAQRHILGRAYLEMRPGARFVWRGMLEDITEKKMASAMLMQCETWMRLSGLSAWWMELSSSADPADPANPVRWSELLARLLGVRAEAPTTNMASLLGFVHPQDRASLEQARRRATVEGSHAVTFRLLSTSGETQEVQEALEVLRDEATGRPIALAGVLRAAGGLSISPVTAAPSRFER